MRLHVPRYILLHLIPRPTEGIDLCTNGIPKFLPQLAHNPVRGLIPLLPGLAKDIPRQEKSKLARPLFLAHHSEHARDSRHRPQMRLYRLTLPERRLSCKFHDQGDYAGGHRAREGRACPQPVHMRARKTHSQCAETFIPASGARQGRRTCGRVLAQTIRGIDRNNILISGRICSILSQLSREQEMNFAQTGGGKGHNAAITGFKASNVTSSLRQRPRMRESSSSRG